MANEQHNMRNIVLTMLSETYDEGIFMNAVIDKYIFKKSFSKTDKNFALMLYCGTVEKTIFSDYFIDKISTFPLKKMKPVIRDILRMSLYQIFFMDSVPDYAAVSEAIKLCNKRKLSGFKGFVNGVLRNAIRHKDIDFPEYVLYSMPEWIYELILNDYTQEEAFDYFEAVSKYNNQLTARVINSETKEVISSLEKDGCTAETLPAIKNAIRFSGFSSLEELNAFKNGNLFIQDAASMLVSDIAADVFRSVNCNDLLEEDMLIIDVCAAPGGKSIGLATEFPKSRIISMDVSDKKKNLIDENIKRLKIKNIEAKINDAKNPDKEYENKADMVICDLPCSGLGVAGRKPDIMLRLLPEDIETLSKLQYEILKKSLSYLKKDGILIYSTCTVTKKENIENALKFVFENDVEFVPFKNISFELKLTENQEKTIKKGYLQLMNGTNETDGFFIAAFKRA